MKIFTKITLGLIVVFAVACGAKDSYENGDVGFFGGNLDDLSQLAKESPEEISDGSEDSRKLEEPGAVERKLIKNGDVTFKAEDLDPVRQKVKDAVKTTGGFISGEVENRYNWRHEITFTLRVPSDKFEQLIDLVTAGVDEVESKNIRVSDVTQEYYDLEARIKTKQQIRERYTDLLAKATTVNDILHVEQELGKIQEELEVFEGRLRVLKNQVGLSTLNLTVYSGKEVKKGWGNKFTKGFKNGWEGLIWFFVALVNLWPLLVVGAILFFILRRVIRRGRQRRQQ